MAKVSQIRAKTLGIKKQTHGKNITILKFQKSGTRIMRERIHWANQWFSNGYTVKNSIILIHLQTIYFRRAGAWPVSDGHGSSHACPWLDATRIVKSLQGPFGWKTQIYQRKSFLDFVYLCQILHRFWELL